MNLGDIPYTRKYWIFALLGISIASIPALRIAAHGNESMGIFADDFFYYLKIGENLGVKNSSTFNFITPTNGYHPLWEWIIAATQSFGMGWQVVYVVAILIFCGGVSTFFAAYILSYNAAHSQLGAGLVAIVATQFYTQLAPTGMEIIVALPTALWFCTLAATNRKYLTKSKSTFAITLLGSLAVLARVDLLILVLSVVAVIALERNINWRAALVAAAGLVPVAGYFLSNIAFFGNVLPVSAAAKQLRPFGPPVVAPIMHTLASGATGKLMVLTMIVSLIGLAVTPIFFRKYIEKNQVLVWACMAAYPFIYFVAVACESDWPVWPWYRYPCVIGAVGGACLVMQAVVQRHESLAANDCSKMAVVAAAAICIGYFVYSVATPGKWNIPAYSNYAVGRHINNQFGATHRGVYAMGDAAGAVGYVMDNPVVQLEGLVMDKDYLRELLSRQPLNTVFAKYRVDYYISTNAERRGDCYFVEEPGQAGPRSPKLRATICSRPVWSGVYGAYHINIFDVR